ncbi:MAG: RNA methyltransferase [Thermofilaceae archaeon]|nr:RNA methyltransferase [Thermofilaceae archaeon]
MFEKNLYETDRSRKPPPRSVVKRRVVIPSNLFVGEDKKLATFRLGLLARFISIFRVEEVVVYGPPNSLVVGVLKYAETPQYLRRKLIPLFPSLKHVGIIPPLQSPHHPASLKGKGFLCEYREGIVIGKTTDSVLVDVGFKEPIQVVSIAKVGERVTVKLTDPPQIVGKRDVPYYWGFSLRVVPNLRSALKVCKKYLKVATSRLGEPIRNVANSLVSDSYKFGRIAIFFGEREKGLLDLALEEGLDPYKVFDYIVNLVPYQGSFTIRTEEAVPLALAILEYLID